MLPLEPSRWGPTGSKDVLASSSINKHIFIIIIFSRVDNNHLGNLSLMSWEANPLQVWWEMCLNITVILWLFYKGYVCQHRETQRKRRWQPSNSQSLTSWRATSHNVHEKKMLPLFLHIAVRAGHLGDNVNLQAGQFVLRQGKSFHCYRWTVTFCAVPVGKALRGLHSQRSSYRFLKLSKKKKHAIPKGTENFAVLVPSLQWCAIVNCNGRCIMILHRGSTCPLVSRESHNFE